MWFSWSISVCIDKEISSWFSWLLDKIKTIYLCFPPIHIVAPEVSGVPVVAGAEDLALCLKQQSKVFPWQRISLEPLSSPLLSPPTSTLECILAASGSVAAPLWLEKELFLYGKAEEQLRKKVKEINMFTPSNSRDFFSVFKTTSFWSLTSQWSIMSYSSMETPGLCKLLQKSRFVLSTFLILFKKNQNTFQSQHNQVLTQCVFSMEKQARVDISAWSCKKRNGLTLRLLLQQYVKARGGPIAVFETEPDSLSWLCRQTAKTPYSQRHCILHYGVYLKFWLFYSLLNSFIEKIRAWGYKTSELKEDKVATLRSRMNENLLWKNQLLNPTENLEPSHKKTPITS